MYVALWEERIEPSSAWQALAPARTRLEDLDAEHAGDVFVGRASRILAAVETRLRSLDPDLARQAVLDGLSNTIGEMIQTIENKVEPAEGTTPPDDGVVTQAIDDVVERLNQVPSAGHEEAVAIADEFRRQLSSVENLVRSIVQAGEEAIGTSTAEHTSTPARPRPRRSVSASPRPKRRLLSWAK